MLLLGANKHLAASMADVHVESAVSEGRNPRGTLPANGAHAEGTSVTLFLLAAMLRCLTRLLRSGRLRLAITHHDR